MPPQTEDATNLEALTEPLLSQEESGNADDNPNESRRKASRSLAIPDAAAEGGDSDPLSPARDAAPAPVEPFCVREEIVAMLSLGFPLAVSFFCRMGMAATDSAFVGHIKDGERTAEVFLSAAVLSDMVLGICITPPLAFNQVLNGLVSQAIGSNNPRMAGIWLQQSMFWLAITMLPCLVGLFFVEPILGLLGFPADICSVAGTYAKYNALWPVPNGLYQCMRFYFQARGLPKPAMYNNIVFLFVNATLNWIFVFGGPIPGWKGFGFIGAAISLSISRTMQGVCYYLYMFVYKKHHIDAWPEEGWSFCHHTKERTMEFMKQSLPNIGTLLFQSCASQATTILVGRLGELPIAASSALSTVTIPWSGTLSATCCTVSGVRVGYHLGRGDGKAAKKSAWLVMHFITAVNAVMAIFFLVPFLKNKVLSIATNDEGVVALAEKLVPAMLVSTYLNLLVSNATSGVFSGQGRPLIATFLSFGLELPLSIGGVAVYILCFHGDLIGVYWWGAIAAGIEIVVVLYLVITSDWAKCATDARDRQEAARNDDGGGDQENESDPEGGMIASEADTDPTGSILSDLGEDDDGDDGAGAIEPPTEDTEEVDSEPNNDGAERTAPASTFDVTAAGNEEESGAPAATAPLAPATTTASATNTATRKKGSKKKRKGKR